MQSLAQSEEIFNQHKTNWKELLDKEIYALDYESNVSFHVMLYYAHKASLVFGESKTIVITCRYQWLYACNGEITK